MAYGEHWEWRAFGPLSPDLLERILALPAIPPDPWQVTDRYLYTPGCTVNVKLRAEELKLKRCLGDDGELERWLEDPGEVFPCPLAPAALRQTAEALGVALARWPERPVDQAALLALLRQAQPAVQTVEVRKTRHLRALALPDAGSEVLVELAQISAPQAILSVALEHPQSEPVRRARARLGLHRTSLVPMSYLHALAWWAQGQPLPILP